MNLPPGKSSEALRRALKSGEELHMRIFESVMDLCGAYDAALPTHPS